MKTEKLPPLKLATFSPNVFIFPSHWFSLRFSFLISVRMKPAYFSCTNTMKYVTTAPRTLANKSNETVKNFAPEITIAFWHCWQTICTKVFASSDPSYQWHEYAASMTDELCIRQLRQIIICVTRTSSRYVKCSNSLLRSNDYRICRTGTPVPTHRRDSRWRWTRTRWRHQFSSPDKPAMST